jgi:hypothetical protein
VTVRVFKFLNVPLTPSDISINKYVANTQQNMCM